MTSRLKPIRKRTSSGERVQFSVEKAYAETPSRRSRSRPSTTSSSAASPASWPSVRGSPRALAHRPLPSMTIATCRGTSSLRDRRRRVRRTDAGVGGRASRSRRLGGLTRLDVLAASAARARGGTAGTRRPARASPRCRSALASATSQSPASSAPSSASVSVAGRRGAGQPAVARTRPRRADGDERRCGPGLAAAGAVGEAGRPAGDRQRAQQVGVEHQAGRVLPGVSARSAPTSSRYCCSDGSLLLGRPAGRRSRASRCRPCSGVVLAEPRRRTRRASRPA